MKRIATVAWLVVLVSGCSASHHLATPHRGNVTPAPAGHRWDVIGTVSRVAFSKNYETHNELVGTTVGPEQIHLVDGRVLRVPALAPVSLAAKNRGVPCTVVGARMYRRPQ